MPTSFDDWHFLFLELQFDQFPEEIGYSLIGYTTSASSATQRSASVTPYIVTTKTPPFYHYSLANQKVTEYIIVPSVEAEYTFILTDLAGDGLCCDFGNGHFTLYNGPVDDNSVLVEGDAPGTSRFRMTALHQSTPMAASNAPTGKEALRYVGVWASVLLLAAIF